jgi:hypothetical protein
VAGVSLVCRRAATGRFGARRIQQDTAAGRCESTIVNFIVAIPQIAAQRAICLFFGEYCRDFPVK